MDYWQIINAVLGLLGAGAIVVVKIMWSRSDVNAQAIQTVREDLVTFRVQAAETYVRYEVLGKLRDEIITHLQRIEDRLEKKADKL